MIWRGQPVIGFQRPRAAIDRRALELFSWIYGNYWTSDKTEGSSERTGDARIRYESRV